MIPKIIPCHYSQSESKKFAASIAVVQRVALLKKIPAILDFPAENFCVQLLRINDFLKLPSNFSHHFILSCVVSSVVNHGEIKMLDLIVI